MKELFEILDKYNVSAEDIIKVTNIVKQIISGCRLEGLLNTIECIKYMEE